MNKILSTLLIISVMCGVLYAKTSRDEFERLIDNCMFKDRNSCVKLIESGNLPSSKECVRANCNFVGKIYANAGYYPSAIQYYKAMLNFGDRRAIIDLGELYYQNGDYEQTRDIAKASCLKEKDSVIKSWGCFSIGFLYSGGIGIDGDSKKALSYYDKACKIGVGKYSAISCQRLGDMYQKTNNTKQMILAKKYYNTSCKLGYQLGCNLYKAFDVKVK